MSPSRLLTRFSMPRVRAGGLALLAVAALTVVVLPPSALTIALAFGAWLLLSRDRALGVLPAALIIVLALPYDRAADVGVLRIAGTPLRPHDVVLVAALALALPGIRRVRWSLGIRLVAIFVAVGVLALVVGAVSGQEPRDILRDVRWWALYGGAVLLAASVRPHARVLRATFIGLSVFCALLIVAALLPPFGGALKERAMTFDQGVLRLQFGPTPFLLLPICWYGLRIIRGAFTWANVVWLAFFVVGLTLSLTRVTLGVLLVVMLLVAAISIWQWRRGWRLRLRGAVVAAGFTVIAILLAIGINVAGVQVAVLIDPALQGGGSGAATTEPAPTPSPSVASPMPSATADASPTGSTPETPVPTPTFAPTGPFARAIPDLARLFAAVSDRFEGYAGAMELIESSPLIGHGLGTLVDVDYTFGAGEFATKGKLPNVDNAYLTVGMKAGLVGIVAFVLMVALPIVTIVRGANRRLVAFWLPAWLGLLALTVTQSFAVIGHSPFVIGLLIAAIDRAPRHWRRRRTADPDPAPRASLPDANGRS